MSVSYGQDEASVTAAYANRQCTEYGKLGMMGTTVLYSSGDDGVAGNSGLCLNAAGNELRPRLFKMKVSIESFLQVKQRKMEKDSIRASRSPVPS